MKLSRALKIVAKNLKSGPTASSYRAGDKLVECRQCENILFHKRKASLSTALSALTGTEWSDTEATVLVCANCSRLEWFLDDLKPENA